MKSTKVMLSAVMLMLLGIFVALVDMGRIHGWAELL